MKVNNKKGFTLAELLIVVAIIGVLIAIAMPTFGKQLEQSRIAADQANLRAAYSEAVAAYLTANEPATATAVGGVVVQNKNAYVKDIRVTHTGADAWVGTTMPFKQDSSNTIDGVKNDSSTNGKYNVKFTFGEDGSATAEVVATASIPSTT